MGTMIQAIPDRDALLFIKDFREEEGKFFLKYRSMRNDIPFRETQVYLADGNQNIVITGTDGTVLYRFSTGFLQNIINKDEFQTKATA